MTKIYALYAAGNDTSLQFETPRTVQVRYLASDEVEEVTLKTKVISTRLAKYDVAITGILNEDFAPEPSERNCPRCPHYFICPAAEDS